MTTTVRRVLLRGLLVVGVAAGALLLFVAVVRHLASRGPPDGMFPDRVWVKWGAHVLQVAETRGGQPLPGVSVLCWSEEAAGAKRPVDYDLAEAGPATLVERIDWYVSGMPGVGSRKVWIASYEVVNDGDAPADAWYESVRRSVERGSHLVLRR